MPGKTQSHVEQLLFQKYSPAAVLLNQDGDIPYLNGRTGALLEPAAGKANWDIHAMARDGSRQPGALRGIAARLTPRCWNWSSS